MPPPRGAVPLCTTFNSSPRSISQNLLTIGSVTVLKISTDGSNSSCVMPSSVIDKDWTTKRHKNDFASHFFSEEA